MGLLIQRRWFFWNNFLKNFQKFFRGLIEFLQKKLQRVFVDRSEPYYICGDTHDFKYLWIYTEKKGLDFYAAKNLLDDFFFRELECECEILCGGTEIRRRELEKSGVYFGETGRREVDVIWCSNWNGGESNPYYLINPKQNN